MPRRAAVLFDGSPEMSDFRFHSSPERVQALVELATLLADRRAGGFDRVDVIINQHPWIAYRYVRERLAEASRDHLLVHEVGGPHFCWPASGTKPGSAGARPLGDSFASAFVDAACQASKHRHLFWTLDASAAGRPQNEHGYEPLPDRNCRGSIVAAPVFTARSQVRPKPSLTELLAAHLRRIREQPEAGRDAASSLEALLAREFGTTLFSWSGVPRQLPFGPGARGERRSATPEIRISVPTRYSKRTVLLVEDNEDNRSVYRNILNVAGFGVIEARNGEDAIRMAREDQPDLILMDISIPLIDGWEATRIVKGDESTSAIPVIALTAHALASDRAKAHECGCDGYLAKPCEPRRVISEVERFIGNGLTWDIEWMSPESALELVAGPTP
jgi:two-component system cell cycle response regulator DivK